MWHMLRQFIRFYSASFEATKSFIQLFSPFVLPKTCRLWCVKSTEFPIKWEFMCSLHTDTPAMQHISAVKLHLKLYNVWHAAQTLHCFIGQSLSVSLICQRATVSVIQCIFYQPNSKNFFAPIKFPSSLPLLCIASKATTPCWMPSMVSHFVSGLYWLY